MKLSDTAANKGKIAETIKGFFSEEFIETTSRMTQFVKRKSKMQGIIFFSLCVYRTARRDNKSRGFMSGVAKGRSKNEKTKPTAAIQ